MLKFNKSPIFANTPFKFTCLYNAPSLRTVDFIGSFLTVLFCREFSGGKQPIVASREKLPIKAEKSLSKQGKTASYGQPASGTYCEKNLVGLRTQTQNAAFFERKGPKRKPWPRGKSFNHKK